MGLRMDIPKGNRIHKNIFYSIYEFLNTFYKKFYIVAGAIFIMYFNIFFLDDYHHHQRGKILYIFLPDYYWLSSQKYFKFATPLYIWIQAEIFSLANPCTAAIPRYFFIYFFYHITDMHRLEESHNRQGVPCHIIGYPRLL